MDSKYIVGVITIAVTAMLVGSVLIPVIDSTNTGTTIVYEDNPDWDGWIRFDLNRSAGAAYEISITQDENGIYVGAGTDVQAYDDSSTGEYATIFYADSNTVVWADDGDAYKIMGTSNGSPVYFTTSDDLTISRDSNGVSVSAGEDSYTFDTPSWAYVPKSTGTYGFYPYDAERGVSVSDDPAAVVGGGFAGVYAYNDITRYAGLGLSAVPIIADGVYYGATWEKVAEETPDDVQITPLDPSIIIPGGDSTQPIINPIDPEPDASIMSVGVPTYTEGDWGYDVIQVDGVDKAAIVSYSGAGGNIVVPATIGGYDVYRFGKNPVNGSSNVTVFNTSLGIDSLTIPYGIKEIGAYAIYGMNSYMRSSLILPDSIVSLGDRAFQMNYFTDGTIVIPESVTTIGQFVFSSTRAANIIIASDATPANSIFSSTSGTVAVLDLSNTIDYSVNRYGIGADVDVQDNIGDCFGFVASSQVGHEEPGGDGPYSFLFAAIPAILLIGVLVIAAGFVIAKRDY